MWVWGRWRYHVIYLPNFLRSYKLTKEGRKFLQGSSKKKTTLEIPYLTGTRVEGGVFSRASPSQKMHRAPESEQLPPISASDGPYIDCTSPIHRQEQRLKIIYVTFFLTKWIPNKIDENNKCLQILLNSIYSVAVVGTSFLLGFPYLRIA